MIRFVNSLAPRRSEFDSKNVIFNLVSLIGIFRSSLDNALRWMPRDLTDDKSRLVQVMAWSRQATSHYLSQCWLSSLSPYGVTKPQCVKKNTFWPCYNLNSVLQNTQLLYYNALIILLRPRQNDRHFEDSFKCILMIEKFCILIQISLKFVPKGSHWFR